MASEVSERIEIPDTPWRVPIERLLPGPIYTCLDRMRQWGDPRWRVPVRVLCRWGGKKQRNVLVEAVNLYGSDVTDKGARWVRPFRGMRRVDFEQRTIGLDGEGGTR